MNLFDVHTCFGVPCQMYVLVNEISGTLAGPELNVGQAWGC